MTMTGSSTSFEFWACNAHGVASRPGHLGLLAAKCPGSGVGTGPSVAGTLCAASAAVAISGTVDPELVVRAGQRTPDAIPSYRRTYPAGALCVCWSFWVWVSVSVSVSGPRGHCTMPGHVNAAHASPVSTRTGSWTGGHSTGHTEATKSHQKGVMVCFSGIFFFLSSFRLCTSLVYKCLLFALFFFPLFLFFWWRLHVSITHEASKSPEPVSALFPTSSHLHIKSDPHNLKRRT